MDAQERSISPYLALVVVQLSFGSFPVVGKVALAVIPAVGLVGFRVGLTALAFVLIQSFRRRVWLKEKKDYLQLAGISFLGIIFNQLLFTIGLSLTKASNTSLLAVTIPIFALATGAVIGSERLRWAKILGIVMAAAGVICLIDPRNASFSSQTTVGDLLIVLNCLSYGIYVAISKSVITRNGALRSIMWIFVFSAVICVPLGAYSMSTVDIENVSPTIWLSVLYVVIVGTSIPYFLNAWALTRVDPSTVAAFVYLQPLIGFILAVIFLGEHIDATFILAAGLIFMGVFLVTRRLIVSET